MAISLSGLPANVPTVKPDFTLNYLPLVTLDPQAPLDSPCTPDSVDLPLPVAINRRRVFSISGGGGIPLSVANNRTRQHPGSRDPLIRIPNSLEDAKELLHKFPPAPPGRRIVNPMSVRVRQCHGCHGYSDESHASIPLGAGKCPRDHDSRCPGGIVGGTSRKGNEWRPCPPNYHGPGAISSSATLDDDSEDDDEDDDEKYSGEENLEKVDEVFKSADNALPGNVHPATTSCVVTTGVFSPSTMSNAGSMPSHSQLSAQANRYPSHQQIQHIVIVRWILSLLLYCN